MRPTRAVTTGRAAARLADHPIRALDSDTSGWYSRPPFSKTRCAHTIESFLPGAVERGKEDCGYSRSLEEMCTGLSKDCVAHIPPNFLGVAHCKVIRCVLTCRYGWAVNDRGELFGQVARKPLQ